MGHLARALVCAGAIAVVACANGGDASDYTGPVEASVHGDTGGGVGPDDAGDPMDTSTGGDDSSEGDDGDDGSSGDRRDSGHTGKGDSGGGGDAGGDGGGTKSCAYSDQCVASATNLGTIPGDASGNTLTATGTSSEWLRIDLDETNSGILGVPMQLAVTLSSPPGTNFDLYAYLGAHIGTIKCTSPKAQSTNPAGQEDDVSFEWGELGTFGNDKDDSATVMLEVRWVSGSCSTGSWSLSAKGG